MSASSIDRVPNGRLNVEDDQLAVRRSTDAASEPERHAVGHETLGDEETRLASVAGRRSERMSGRPPRRSRFLIVRSLATSSRLNGIPAVFLGLHDRAKEPPKVERALGTAARDAAPIAKRTFARTNGFGPLGDGFRIEWTVQDRGDGLGPPIGSMRHELTHKYSLATTTRRTCDRV